MATLYDTPIGLVQEDALPAVDADPITIDYGTRSIHIRNLTAVYKDGDGVETIRISEGKINFDGDSDAFVVCLSPPDVFEVWDEPMETEPDSIKLYRIDFGTQSWTTYNRLPETRKVGDFGGCDD